MDALINDKSVYQRINAGAAAMQEDMEALKHNFLLRGFFNRRGYEDSVDRAKHAIRQLPAAQVSRNFTYEASKLFDNPDAAKLKSAKAVNEAGKFPETNPFGLAVVAVYADMKGDTERNRLLTEARVMVIRDYLVQNFKLDDTRIKTIGQGKIRVRQCTRGRRRNSGLCGWNESSGHAAGFIVETLAKREPSIASHIEDTTEWSE